MNDIESIAQNAINIVNNLNTLQKLIENQTLFLKEPIDEEIYNQLVTFTSQSHQLYDDAVKALFKREYKEAENLISKRESLSALESELIMLMSSKKLDPNIASVLRLIFDSARRIMDYSKNMADLTLNRTVEEICSTLASK